MSLRDYKFMLDKITGLSVTTLDIIGGEPTLHSDIIHFVRAAERRGLRVNISSNGTNTEMLEEMSAIGNNVTVGVSINDRETLVRLKKFIQKNKPMVKSIFNPAMDRNMIHDILLFEPKKFFLIYRDAMEPSDLNNTVPFHRFMAVAQRQFNASNIDTVFCSGFLPDTQQYPELTTTRCPAGATKLGILPDGSVYPCNLFFGRKGFLLGNILHDSFKTIWNHTALAFFRTFIGNTCPQKQCELHAQCHGGCPAHALFLNGDLAAPDPRCSKGNSLYLETQI